MDSLFEVYYDLGNEYVKKKFFERKDMENKAREKIRQKYGIVEKGA